MEDALVELVLVEECCLVDIEVVVVTEHVAFLDVTVGVVDVVLYIVAVDAEITYRELVDIGVFLCAHKVVHGLVVHALGCSNLQACSSLVVAVEVYVQR